MIKPIILCGGNGKRLWPLSNSRCPKPFLHIHPSSYSLFQQTLKRLDKISALPPTILCNKDHFTICKEQLKTINTNKVNYILEPIARNTAPALAIAAFQACESGESDVCFLVLPADHLIENKLKFLQAIQAAEKAAYQDFIVMLAIKPTSVETDYGYIKLGPSLPCPNIFAVKKFVEKPNLEKAKEYIANHYYWNSGIFMFKPSVYLTELKKLAADIYDHAYQSFKQAKVYANILEPHEENFAACRDLSLDYAVMEKTSVSAVVLTDMTWNDIGNWKKLYEINQKNEYANVIQGNVLAENTYNCYIQSEHTPVISLGLQDHVVVNTEQGVLVAHQDHIPQLKSSLETMFSTLKLDQKKNHRPWGYYEILEKTEHYVVKKVVIQPHQSVSLQLHQHRSEHWVVVSGVADVILGEKKLRLNKNQNIHIPCKTIHRMTNNTDEPLIVIETQIGEFICETDIVRFEDQYQRVTLPM